MNPAYMGAIIAGVAFVVGIAIQGAAFAFLFGRHAEKLSTNESDIRDLKRKSEEHSTAISGMDGINALLKEVRDDVKNLLTGRIRPGRSNGEG